MVQALKKTTTLWGYETKKLAYSIPESNHVYTPDFVLANGIYLEGKGRLTDHAERYKYELVKKQYPNIDLRFVFGNPQKLCGGTTKMTHAQWAESSGFPYCSVKDTEIIMAWANEEQHG